MMLYNWSKMFDEASADPATCVRIFRMLAAGSIPKNRRDPIFKFAGIDFSGDSFLYHEDVIWANSFKHSNKEICYYLALASLRSLGEFLATGKTTLDIIQAPVDPRDYMSDRSLIYVENDDIHFVYEETKNFTLH